MILSAFMSPAIINRTSTYSPGDFRGLKAFSDESIAKKYIVVCREEKAC